MPSGECSRGFYAAVFVVRLLNRSNGRHVSPEVMHVYTAELRVDRVGHRGLSKPFDRIRCLSALKKSCSVIALITVFHIECDELR